MDKKTLTFLILMTAAFFLMNQWFNYGRRDSSSLIDQPKTQVIFSGDMKTPAPLSSSQRRDLHITMLYRDIDLKEKIGYGIRHNDSFVSIAKILDLPQFAYIQFEDQGSTLRRRIELMVPPQNVGDPYLYTAYPLSKLETPWVPEEGTLEVSLIYFTDQDAFEIRGETLGDQKLILEQKPPQNGIAMLHYNDSVSPYAIFESSGDKLYYLDHYPSFDNFSLLVYPSDKKTKVEMSTQEYYVLENPYMQLVFSTMNGALAEINLPFFSKENPLSVVKEIGIDRIMQSDYPYNNTFPQNPYYIPTGNGGKKRLDPVQGGYYPLLRRDLIGIAGETTTHLNPNYYALNITESDKSHEPVLYTLKRFEKNLIEFESSSGNRRITKIYTLPSNPKEAPYAFDLSIKIEGDGRNLSLATGLPEVELISGSFSPTLKFETTRNRKRKIEEIKPPKDLITFSNALPNWSCNGNGFFGVILDPKGETRGLSVFPVSGELAPSRITVIDAEYQLYPTSKYPAYAMTLPLATKSGISHYHIFAGPFDKKILETVSTAFIDPSTGYRPDLVSVKTYYGWFAAISAPFGKFLFIIMNFFHDWTNSWGFSIILLTVVLRLMLYPLNSWSMKSMAKMQKATPKIQEIQEKYKKDPKRVQMEIMQLYKREGVNPLGGCFPMIIQLPFLFGMLELLKSSFELRGASFIPGWIDNLTAPDVLFSWSYPIPFVGTSFHLLPFILGGVMYFQQKITSIGSTNQPVTDQQKQQRMMGNMMTIIFTVLFYHFPSGLNIYWISSMALGILQQWWITKKQLKGAK